MYPLCADDNFCQSLHQFDLELFLLTKAKGCPHCNGPLDTSNYVRKTRGMGKGSELRYSLCCRHEGCRRRLTPRSVRFLGRKVYGAWVVILALDFCHDLGLKGKIARQTLARWKRFWKERLLPSNPFLMWAKGFLAPGTVLTDRPLSFFTHFGFPARESWLPILKFFTHEI